MYGVLCPRAQAVGSYGHHMYLNPEISWLTMHTHAMHVPLESPSAPCEKHKLWTVATAVQFSLSCRIPPGQNPEGEGTLPSGQSISGNFTYCLVKYFFVLFCVTIQVPSSKQSTKTQDPNVSQNSTTACEAQHQILRLERPRTLLECKERCPLCHSHY